MQDRGRRCFGVFLGTAIVFLLLTGIRVSLPGSQGARAWENSQWVATSNSWLDRQLCNWFELCGTQHLNSRTWVWGNLDDDLPVPIPDETDYWHSGQDDSASWDDEEKERREIPQYVLDHAPYVHLFSGEQFWPCDLSEHLIHTSPFINYTKILDLDHEINVTNLNDLNHYDGSLHGRFMYLQSDDNVEKRPEWLGGDKNIPSAPRIVPFRDQDDEAIWPTPTDAPLVELDIDEHGNLRQQAFVAPVGAQGATTGISALPTFAPSPNGRCGGSSGFTCKGSTFGGCCSIYGWCGTGNEYCGPACEALAGDCNDPFQIYPRPHSDLRKRGLDKQGAKHKPSPIGYSSAPAILIVVKKPGGILDAFWFFFYSYNLGQKVLNIRFGNHVGDWEHTMVRFRNGSPEAVFLSEHDFGDAYRWRAVEKYLPNHADNSGTMLGTWSNTTAARLAKRPVIYSAVGSHAMYATPGVHPYILPWGILHDQTDRGPLWDPSLNFISYVYDPATDVAEASSLTPKAPVNWFHFAGHWGDKDYPLSDPRQYRFAGQYHYVNGPLGPKFKNLGRKSVCQADKRCHLRDWVGDKTAGRRRAFPLSPEESDFEEMPREEDVADDENGW